MSQTVSADVIQQKIFVIRGRKVMLDHDLAQLYGVPTKVLNQAVKRHRERFPDDFMFQLTKQELENWKSQIVTSNREKFGLRKRPFVFSEHGILMLSSVLNSDRAIQVNIAIMRAFVQIREMLLTHKEFAAKLEALELKYKNHDLKFSEYDKHIAAIFEAIKQLLSPPPEPPKKKMGFLTE